MNLKTNKEKVPAMLIETHPVFQITKVSKCLAVALFVTLPFIGGYVGYKLTPEKHVDIFTPGAVIIDTEQETASTIVASASSSSDDVSNEQFTVVTNPYNNLTFKTPREWECYFPNNSMSEFIPGNHTKCIDENGDTTLDIFDTERSLITSGENWEFVQLHNNKFYTKEIYRYSGSETDTTHTLYYYFSVDGRSYQLSTSFNQNQKESSIESVIALYDSIVQSVFQLKSKNQLIDFQQTY